MRKTKANTKKAESVRVRGYEIRSEREGQGWMKTKQFIWHPEPHLPPEWEATKRDPHVREAILIRSGRRYATYRRSP
jgi:hypothetical protein